MSIIDGKSLKEVCDMMYPKQLEAFLECLNGEDDVIITGSGGSGKSFIIDALVHFAGSSTVVTGTTGTAAVNVSGATTHSTLSLPLGLPTKKDMANVSKRFRSLFTKKHKVERVIIDESSMLSPQGFDAIYQRKKRISKSSRKGNVRLLFFGDWTQLLNVSKQGQERDLVLQKYGTTTLLDSDIFYSKGLKVIELDETKRTSDPELKGYLEDVRFGRNLDVALSYFNKQVSNIIPEGVTYIATTNAKVDRINKRAFDSNQNTPFYYYAKIKGVFNGNDTLMQETLILKEGLRVMAISNDPEQRFVNGSCGTVVDLMHGAVIVKFDNGEEVLIETIEQKKKEYFTDLDGELCSREIASFEQIPLKQCDAVTVFKAQGMSLDKAVLDLGDWVFAEGLTYTGLSRMTNIAGLTLVRPIAKKDIKVNPHVRNFYNKLHGIDPIKIRILVYCSTNTLQYKDLAIKWLDFLLQNYGNSEIELVPFCSIGTDYAYGRGIAVKRTKDGITHALVIGNDQHKGFNDAVNFVRLNNIRAKVLSV